MFRLNVYLPYIKQKCFKTSFFHEKTLRRTRLNLVPLMHGNVLVHNTVNHTDAGAETLKIVWLRTSLFCNVN